MTQFDITINDSLKEHLNEAEQITLQLLSRKVLEMVQQELPKQISSSVSFQSVVLSNTSLKSIKTNDLVPAMLIKGTDQNTKKVPFLFLCKQALIRQCINQIMGLENDPTNEAKFDEFDMSAASEMMNALFQQAAMQISEVANKEIIGLMPSVGLFKNFGDFLQTLRLTSDAPITQIQFDIRIGDETPSPCLVVMDFKAVSKFIGELGSITMNMPSESISEPVQVEESVSNAAPEPVSTPVSDASNSGMMSQDAIEAMLARKAAEASAAEPAPTPSTSTASSGGVMSQDAIEAMLARKAVETRAPESKVEPVASTPVTSPASTPIGGGVMSQDAIEAMLARKAAEDSNTKPAVNSLDSVVSDPSPTVVSAPVPTPASTPVGGGVMSQDAIEAMLSKKALEMQAPAKPAVQTAEPKRSITSLHYGNNEPEAGHPKHKHDLPAVEEPQTFFSIPMIQSNMDLVMNVPLTISVEIGRTKKKIKEILEFQPGTVIELDKQHSSPMDVIVNGELFARGEVVVFEENFGVRLTEINSKINANNQ